MEQNTKPVHWLGVCRFYKDWSFRFTVAFGEYVSLGCFNTISSVKVLQTKQIFIHFVVLNESGLRCILLPATATFIVDWSWGMHSLESVLFAFLLRKRQIAINNKVLVYYQFMFMPLSWKCNPLCQDPEILWLWPYRDNTPLVRIQRYCDHTGTILGRVYTPLSECPGFRDNSDHTRIVLGWAYAVKSYTKHVLKPVSIHNSLTSESGYTSGSYCVA